MLRRFSVNFAILSMLFDGLLTASSLWLAYQTRPILTQIEWLHVPVLHPSIPIWMYFIVPIMWVLVFLGLSAYDPKRLYYATDEMRNKSVCCVAKRTGTRQNQPIVKPNKLL